MRSAADDGNEPPEIHAASAYLRSVERDRNRTSTGAPGGAAYAELADFGHRTPEEKVRDRIRSSIRTNRIAKGFCIAAGVVWGGFVVAATTAGLIVSLPISSSLIPAAIAWYGVLYAYGGLHIGLGTYAANHIDREIDTLQEQLPEAEKNAVRLESGLAHEPTGERSVSDERGAGFSSGTLQMGDNFEALLRRSSNPGATRLLDEFGAREDPLSPETRIKAADQAITEYELGTYELADRGGLGPDRSLALAIENENRSQNALM
jgi:hypothetical protein